MVIYRDDDKIKGGDQKDDKDKHIRVFDNVNNEFSSVRCISKKIFYKQHFDTA